MMKDRTMIIIESWSKIIKKINIQINLLQCVHNWSNLYALCNYTQSIGCLSIDLINYLAFKDSLSKAPSFSLTIKIFWKLMWYNIDLKQYDDYRLMLYSKPVVCSDVCKDIKNPNNTKIFKCGVLKPFIFLG